MTKITVEQIIDSWELSGHMSAALHSFYDAATTPVYVRTVRSLEEAIQSIRDGKAKLKEKSQIEAAHTTIKTLNKEISRLRKKMRRGGTFEAKKVTKPKPAEPAATVATKPAKSGVALHEAELKRVHKASKALKKEVAKETKPKKAKAKKSEGLPKPAGIPALAAIDSAVAALTANSKRTSAKKSKAAKKK